jgi:hypothetical protein
LKTIPERPSSIAIIAFTGRQSRRGRQAKSVHFPGATMAKIIGFLQRVTTSRQLLVSIVDGDGAP